ncbi:MAG: hypothetical protein K0S32_1702 [Bacteroidetes bacterium]|jgi:hypothetical protein|nr:hypothetical protein [Bacteroidota bacterium]
MKAKTESMQDFYQTLLGLMKHREVSPGLPEKDKAKFCFMLHDEVLNEIHKIEVDDLFEWLNDGSFEKKDKLYISFLIKEN